MPAKQRHRRHYRPIGFGKLDHRAAPGSFERLQYLEKLVIELKETDIHDYKEQIIANLANFAYDPRNVVHLRQLHVADLFLNCLESVAPTWAEAAAGCEPKTVEDGAVRLAELALGGLVNLASVSAADRKELRDHPKLAYVVACLAAPHSLIVIHCLTVLIQLFTLTRGTATQPEFTTDLQTRFPAAIRVAQAYRQQRVGDSSNDPRVSTLSQLLLEDCC